MSAAIPTPPLDPRLAQYLDAWRSLHRGAATAAQVNLISRRLNQIALREADKLLSRRNASTDINGPTTDAIEDIAATLLMQMTQPDLKMRQTVGSLLDAIAQQKTEEALQAALKEFNSFIVRCIENKAHDAIFRDHCANAVALDAPVPSRAADSDRAASLPVESRTNEMEEAVVRRLSVEAALQTLSETKRRVVRLHLYEEYSLTEIAAQLSLSDNTVRSHYRRALNDLRGVSVEY